MNLLYNTNFDIANDLKNFLSNIDFNLSKPQLNIIPNILISIINAENITNLDISKVFFDNSLLSNFDSIQKKLWRFFNNPKFNGPDFFLHSIKHIISNSKALKHNKLVVVMDHMFMKNNFVVLMFSLKCGKQSIPIWFKCDKTKNNRHHELDVLNQKCLFSENVIFSAILDVIDLLSPLNTKITFLADRWFCNLNLMKFINNLGHFYCIRAKANSNINIFIYDKREHHNINKRLSDLKPWKNVSLYYYDLELGDFHFKSNLSIARGKLSSDPWFILSNIEPNKVLREYSHRFGAIECLFKSQKTNGFNLEKTKIKNLHAFENLYSLVCFCCVWLSIIGIDYTKNFIHVKNKLNIRFIKRDKNNKAIRILSLFNLGLTIFRRCFNSYINYKIKCNMQLYL